MEVSMPMTGNAMDSYEDMFKEITRKLYGEDGLPDLTTDRLVSTSQDRLVSLDYDVEGPMLKPEEHLTAFGLAALMQNGFPSSGILNTTFTTLKPQATLTVNSAAVATNAEDKWVHGEEVLQWTQSKIATYNPSQKLFRCAECDCVGYLLRVAEHWLGTHSNIRAFHCPQCTYESAWARCVKIHLNRQHNIEVDESCEELTKDNPVLQEVIKYLQRLKNKVDGGCGSKPEDFQNLTPTSAPTISTNLEQTTSSTQTNQSTTTSTTKRYSCTYCPYATDRRDLFTRHENIHREEKPFQCYVCQKQFNRADHVKKHFLRMHRDHPYDLNRIRRHPPKNASGMSYYQKYNATVAGTSTSNLQQDTLTTLTTIGSLSIPGFNNITRNQATLAGIRQPEVKSLNGKTNAINKPGSKKKGEKRFTCCYCSWSGVDNWCLKRHMNTHLKPFVCVLCDYKAARSERLATHVLKVHNKRSCSKCNFLAEDLAQLAAHQQEQHPNEHRSRTSATTTSNTTQPQTSTNNILRANPFSNTATPSATVSLSTAVSSSSLQPIIQSTTQGSQLITLCGEPSTTIKTSDLTAAAAAQILQHNRFLQTDLKASKTQLLKPHGAARLFNYLEASDGSDQEDEEPIPRNTDGDLVSRVTLIQRIQSDFLEAGGVDNQQEADEEIPGEETELPPFVCTTCGCEFEDDSSLETHQLTHRHVATSPAPKTNEKENVHPGAKYVCKLCDAHFDTQNNIVAHLIVHTGLAAKPVVLPTPSNKSKRKQHKPTRVVVPYWDSDEVEVLRHLSSKLRKWRDFLTSENSGGLSKLVDKYMARLVTRRGLVCRICKNSGIVRYHTKASLTLHHYQKHSRIRYRCEHCNMTFKHKYQIILHSSRVHTEPQKPITITTNLTVMMPATITHPRDPPSSHISLENISSTDLSNFTNFFTTSHNVAVPDGNISNSHKLGMSFFDHTFIHNNTINTHMPIIIPTFQPT